MDINNIPTPRNQIPTTGNKVVEGEPATHVLNYHHLGLAVSDLVASRAFYAKLGFVATSDNDDCCLRNSLGMEIHLIQADVGVQDDKNILQDMGNEKHCGHTHVCFAVPSVAAARTFLEAQGVRNTLEFERNVGDKVVDNFDVEMIGDARRLDHVGTRVTDPAKSWKWYGEMLGFTEEVIFYEHNSEPLKRFIPWISRTQSGVDVNFLLNGNQLNDQNILLKDGVLKPGFLYAGLEVKDLEASKEALKKAGVSVYETEEEVASLGLKKDKIPSCITGPSVFIADPDKNLYRLVQSQ